MKKIIYSIALVATSLVYGQVTAPGNLEIVGQDKNTFLDASGYTDLADKSAVKGLNFPRTDLTKFKFNVSDLGNYQYSKTAFDGVIVYNIGTGTTGADKNTQGEQVNVEPGFYFFYHPTATEDTNNVSKGRWVRIGDDYSATPNYVAVGTFVHDGGNSAVLSKMPNAADFKAIKSISIRRTDENAGKLEGGVVITSLYSYDDATKKAVFGQGAMSTSIPAGNYEYVIGYSK